jgi:hypothetical protein
MCRRPRLYRGSGTLGQEIEQVLPAGSRIGEDVIGGLGLSRQKIVSVGTSIVPPGPITRRCDTAARTSFHDFAASLGREPRASAGRAVRY